MTEIEAMQVFKELLDVPCEKSVKYDFVITEEQKKALVKIRIAEYMAIKSLEKQIPKKPFKDYCWHCPNCEEEVYWDTECGQQKFRYCHNCGQKIDWH